jgi:hypothetical protein
MKPRPRIRKFFKWGGLVVSVLLLTVWVGSAYVTCLWVSGSRHEIAVDKGLIFYQWCQPTIRPEAPALRWWTSSQSEISFALEQGAFSDGWFVIIPVWFFVALSLVTTAAAWRMDIIARRKSRLGMCPACGYDRTGLAPAAPCPECNAKA